VIKLSEHQIAAAKANDLSAVSAVVAATDGRVVQLARKYATTGTRTDLDLADDLAQIGREAVWQAIGRFEGTDVAQFFAFINRTLEGVLSDERRRGTRQGVNQQAAKDFERAVTLAGGDPHEAERLASSTAAMGLRKMSPEMAYAARLAWQGTDSLDAPLPGSEGSQTLADTIGVPEDLLEPADYNTARRKATRDRVHATLARLSERQADVIRATWGIPPELYFGPGENDELLADEMGITVYQVQQARTYGYARFKEIWEAEDRRTAVRAFEDWASFFTGVAA
jgi:RNA polymerase sigma factor (sigma-70 family)